MGNKAREQKFFLLYESQADALFRFVFFRVSDREAAKDIVQEAFLKMWETLCSDKDIQNERAFLFRIASNLVIDRYRKTKEYSLDSLAEQGFDAPDDPGIPIETRIDVGTALELLQRLPEKYHEAVWLRAVEEWSVKDIAALFDETENVISVRIHRGLKLWRKQISEDAGKKSGAETSKE
ncbi:MAG: RNA polymerase sigma factor [Candidatus Moraniibacteriota bacterium]